MTENNFLGHQRQANYSNMSKYQNTLVSLYDDSKGKILDRLRVKLNIPKILQQTESAKI